MKTLIKEVFSLDVLTTNALIASDSLVITSQTEFHSTKALGSLNSVISEIKEQINNIALSGANYVAIATPYDQANHLYQRRVLSGGLLGCV